jgi:hypothetical protein
MAAPGDLRGRFGARFLVEIVIADPRVKFQNRRNLNEPVPASQSFLLLTFPYSPKGKKGEKGELGLSRQPLVSERNKRHFRGYQGPPKRFGAIFDPARRTKIQDGRQFCVFCIFESSMALWGPKNIPSQSKFDARRSCAIFDDPRRHFCATPTNACPNAFFKVPGKGTTAPKPLPAPKRPTPCPPRASGKRRAPAPRPVDPGLQKKKPATTLNASTADFLVVVAPNRR